LVKLRFVLKSSYFSPQASNPVEVDDFVHIPSLTNSFQPFSLTQEFEAHLKSLNTSQVQPFDLNKFKTCSDEKRKECALKMLNYALVEPKKAKRFAILSLNILRLNVKSSAKTKPFNVHLSEACEASLKIFNNFNYKSAQTAENLGIFIAELYNLEIVRAQLINIWLEEMKKHADRDNLMLKLFINVFKVAFEKMIKNNKRNAQIYINHMNVYRQQKRLPKQFAVWHDSILLNSAIGYEKSRSLSTVSNTSAGSGASGSTSGSTQADQKATGAIKKV
jgi:hypothetical protein